MAVVSKDDILQRINSIIPDGNEDVTLLEDVTDTFDYFENNSQTDYQEKYTTLLKKYRDRFTDGTDAMEDRETNKKEYDEEANVIKRQTYDDLFIREV